MRSEDFGAFATEMAHMSELYQKPMSEAMIALYFDDLAAYEIEAVISGLHAHRVDPDRGRFFPKPADIVEKIGGDIAARALLAWDHAVAAAIDVGPYESVRFRDPVITRVIAAMGGWTSFYDWPDKEMPFKRKEFCDRYAVYARTNRHGDVGHLVGLFERQNALNGHLVKPPVLVGAEPTKALPASRVEVDGLPERVE